MKREKITVREEKVVGDLTSEYFDRQKKSVSFKSFVLILIREHVGQHVSGDLTPAHAQRVTRTLHFLQTRFQHIAFPP